MSAVSAPAQSDARPRASLIEERMRTGKGTALSAALGKSDSWARKVLDGESGVMLGDIPRLLSELGLKVVGQDRVCVPRDEFLAYRTLAERYVATPRSLEWDES